MDDRVRVERAEGIAEVRLVRADKHNGLDHRMFQALLEAGRGLLDDPGLRAVVLSGEGPSFCAGLDFASFMREGIDPATVLRAEEGSPANFAQRVAWIWRELPVPVIAALHGHVYGGGLQLALAADLRYVTPDAKLSVREIHWGLVPDMSGTQTLRHLVRLDVAKELTFTGRIVEHEVPVDDVGMLDGHELLHGPVALREALLALQALGLPVVLVGLDRRLHLVGGREGGSGFGSRSGLGATIGRSERGDGQQSGQGQGERERATGHGHLQVQSSLRLPPPPTGQDPRNRCPDARGEASHLEPGRTA